MNDHPIPVRLKRVSDNTPVLPLPVYATQGSAGFDLHADINDDIVIRPMGRAVVGSGLAASIPPGFEIQVRPRSGLAAKHGVTVLNAPGTIDSDYRGEIGVILANLSDTDFVIKRGDRIAQAILSEYARAEMKLVDSLDETERGAGGFGSTGRN